MSLLGSLAGAVVGGLFQRSSEKRQNRYAVQNTIESLPRLRESAEKAGFNPLTALLASGGSGFNAGAPNVAPLASASVIKGIVDDASDLMTGKAAQDTARQKVQDDIASLQLEKMKAGGAQNIVVRTSQANTLPNLTQSSPARLGNTSTSFTPQNEAVRPPKMTLNKEAEPIEPNEVHVIEQYTTSSGETVDVPMGPDLDEIVSGIGIEGAGKIKKANKGFRKYDQALQDGEHPLNPFPEEKAKDSIRFDYDKKHSLPDGVEKPKGWDRWHPDRRAAWLVRWGHKKP